MSDLNEILSRYNLKTNDFLRCFDNGHIKRNTEQDIWKELSENLHMSSSQIEQAVRDLIAKRLIIQTNSSEFLTSLGYSISSIDLAINFQPPSRA